MFLLFAICIFIFGLIIGSFLNCLIWRLYKEEKIASIKKSEKKQNRSYCPKCRKTIAWYDNIPVFSFIILQAKCRHCEEKISWQYPLVELSTAILFLLFFWRSNIIFSQNLGFDTLYLGRNLLAAAVMIIIFTIDFRWYLILDKVTLPTAVIFFLVNLVLGFSLWNLLISGIIGSSFFLLQFLISKGKWIGGGDIRLGFLMGFILGWPNILLAIILAYFIGSIVGIILIIAKKKQWSSQIPLGIFLSTSTIIVLLIGEFILSWYINLL